MLFYDQVSKVIPKVDLYVGVENFEDEGKNKMACQFLNCIRK